MSVYHPLIARLSLHFSG